MALPTIQAGVPVQSTLADWTDFFVHGDPDDDDVNGFAGFVADVQSLASANSYTGLEVQVFGRGFVWVGNLLTEVATNFDPSRATGDRLVTIARLNNVTPNPGKNSTIAMRFEGLGGTDISGRRYRYVPNGSVWLAPSSTVANANGVALFEAVAVDSGPVEALAAPSSQWEQVTVRADTTSIESTAPAVIGVAPWDTETLRANATPASILAGNIVGIERELRNVAGTTDVDPLVNRKLVINADGVAPKTIEWVVEGGTDLDVATVLLTTMSSMQMQGNTTLVVSGFKDPAIWTRPTRIRVQAEITLTEGELGLPTNVQTVVAQAIGDLVNGLGRGLDVLLIDIAAAALTALGPGAAGTIAVKLRVFGGVFGVADISVTKRQRAIAFSDPQPAIITGTKMQPFNLIDGENIDISVNGGAPFSAFMTSGDFDISAASAADVANVINEAAGSDGIVAAVSVGMLDLRTLLTGPGTSLEILGSSAPGLLTTLGLSVGTVSGTVGDIEVVVV